MARYETVLVTPSMARQWLDRNVEENRSAKKSKIPGYARDMKTGKWESDTGETIKFDPDGNLFDGANRMRAVILAGVPVTFDVAYDVPRRAMRVIDSGASRSAADAGKIVGARSRARSMAIVRWSIMWDAKFYMGQGGGLNPTHSEILDRFDAEAGLYDAAATRATDCQNRGIATGAPAGVAYYLFSRLDQEKAHAFFDQYVSGANLPDLSPVLALRDKMARLRIDRLTRPEQLCCFVRAWNGWRKDETMTRIVTSPVGPLTNDNFPMPK